MNAPVFAAVFAVLGLRLLFGGYSVGLGHVVLLSAVSAATTVALQPFLGNASTGTINFDNVTFASVAQWVTTAQHTVSQFLNNDASSD